MCSQQPFPGGFKSPPAPRDLADFSLSIFAPVKFHPISKGPVARSSDARCHCRLSFGAVWCGAAGCGWDPSRRGVGVTWTLLSIPRLTLGQRSLLSHFATSPSLLPLSFLTIFPLLLGEPGKSPFEDRFAINWGSGGMHRFPFINLLLLGDQGIPLIPGIPMGQRLRGYSAPACISI